MLIAHNQTIDLSQLNFLCIESFPNSFNTFPFWLFSQEESTKMTSLSSWNKTVIIAISIILAFQINFNVAVGPSPPSNTGEQAFPRRASAVIYENRTKEGSKHAYLASPSGWSDIRPMVEELIGTNGNGGKTTPALCVTGAWLVYAKADYKIGENDKAKLLSGNENCMNLSKTFPVGSIQPASPLILSALGSITLFTRPHFGSSAHSISADESLMAGVTQLSEPLTPIGSMIIAGQRPWSLISSKGQVICVRPSPKRPIQEGPLTLCFGLDLLDDQLTDFQVIAVSPDCPDEGERKLMATLNLTNCLKYGVTQTLPPLQKKDKLGRALEDQPAIELKCPPKYEMINSKKFTPEETKLIMKLVNIRLHHDFSSDSQLLWPDAKQDIWQTAPLDIVFDIVLETVPETVVNLQYLRIIREFTVFHLNEVWKEQRAKGKKNRSKLRNWKSHKVINHLLSKCLKMAVENRERYQSAISSEYTERTMLKKFLTKIHPAFVMRQENDPVIETTWVVVNYAMGLCHEAFKYQINFWDNFVATFRQLYFVPLADRWRKPKISPQVLRVVLSGYGTEAQYKRIAFAATKMLQLTPNLNPFESYKNAMM